MPKGPDPLPEAGPLPITPGPLPEAAGPPPDSCPAPLPENPGPSYADPCERASPTGGNAQCFLQLFLAGVAVVASEQREVALLLLLSKCKVLEVRVAYAWAVRTTSGWNFAEWRHAQTRGAP